MPTSGSCFCGQTTWEFDGDPSWGCYCHCDDCRRNCSAPIVAWLGVTKDQFRWTGQDPKTLESSKGVYRHFCDTCGSPMAFVADHYPDTVNLYAASLDDPKQFIPTFHVNFESKLPWLGIDDDLPKYEGTLLQVRQDGGDPA